MLNGRRWRSTCLGETDYTHKHIHMQTFILGHKNTYTHNLHLQEEWADDIQSHMVIGCTFLQKHPVYLTINLPI